MRAVLIGSAPYRPDPSDYDIVADKEWFDSFLTAHRANLDTDQDLLFGRTLVFKFPLQVPEIIEVTLPNPGTAWEMLLSFDLSVYSRQVMEHMAVQATLPVLATLLKAHLIKPHPKWERHIENYKRVKGLLGVTEEFNPKDWGTQELYKLHRKEVKATTKAHPKLNTNKQEFFKGPPYQVFDHDSIHRALAEEQAPAYTQMKGDQAEVWCDRGLWDAMPKAEKMRCVIEESAILALERSVIPALFIPGRTYAGAKWAYTTALQKLCQTISSGFFRDYCIEHYHEAIVAMPDINSLFFKGLANGTIICLKPELLGVTNAATAEV